MQGKNLEDVLATFGTSGCFLEAPGAHSYYAPVYAHPGLAVHLLPWPFISCHGHSSPFPASYLLLCYVLLWLIISSPGRLALALAA